MSKRRRSYGGRHKTRLNRPGEKAIQGHKYPPPGSIDAYICRDCGCLTIVRVVDPGVVPKWMACLVNEECEGRARSSNYQPNVPEKVKAAVAYEWYRPSWAEFRRLDAEKQLHVERGGVLLRAI